MVMDKEMSALLIGYKDDVNNVKKYAKDLGLNDKTINRTFKESFGDFIKTIKSSKPKDENNDFPGTIYTITNIFLLSTVLGIFVYVLLNIDQLTSSIVLRNVQGLTFPILKIIRFLSVPVIKLLPCLTDLYDETCLVENPYFYVADMECWPCKNVNSVLDITGTEEDLFKYRSGLPFVIKTDQKIVTFKTLQDMYIDNMDIFKTEERRVKSTNSNVSTIEELFDYNLGSSFSSKMHISWRINKMAPARIIRRVFPRPSFIFNRTGQSVERFIVIDEVKAESYVLPNTECSYIFVIQGSGERTIILRPSSECGQNCKTISVVLKPSYVLWYNWWYWRPLSLPTGNSTGPSISYINSYC